MNSILFLAVFACVVALALVVFRRKMPSNHEGPWPFIARKPMSASEQILYFRLREAVPDHIVLAQVSVSRLLAVEKGQNVQAWNNRISRLSADFVVCKKDASVVAVVELDDASHESKERRRADAKKDRALGAAGIPVLRWQAKTMPDIVTIRRTLGQQRPNDTETPNVRAA